MHFINRGLIIWFQISATQWFNFGMPVIFVLSEWDISYGSPVIKLECFEHPPYLIVPMTVELSSREQTCISVAIFMCNVTIS